jgi:diaminopimelate epimerase
MQIAFQKYQGAGNDFIMLDNRDSKYSGLNTAQIAQLCHRNKGIGADGLILVEQAEKADFKMVYFNADGKESTMCGNGGRCVVAFAKALSIIDSQTTFEAIDGLHEAEILSDQQVRLGMTTVSSLTVHQNALVLNTGSPHYVALQDTLAQIDMVKEGAAIRNSEPFKAEGINVNFIACTPSGELTIRTYERGVENETLACGTGAVAGALAADHWNLLEGKNPIRLHALGGTLEVAFNKNDQGYEKITLLGPAEYVFSGTIIC